jgi:hypothetical protein
MQPNKCLIILVLCLLSVAHAQKTPPVGVSFEFSEPELTQLLPRQELLARQNEISSTLAKKCWDLIHIWDFGPGDSDRSAVHVFLENSGAWKIQIQLQLASGPSQNGPWSISLFKPQDLDSWGGRLPSLASEPQVWSRFITDAFVRFLNANKKDLIQQLRLVPLGSHVFPIFQGSPGRIEDARAVLPLEWQKYKNLNQSDFRIDCRSSGGDAITVYSRATGAKMSFKDPVAAKVEGIVVQYREFESSSSKREDIRSHLADLSNYRPVGFYLEQLNAPREDQGQSVDPRKQLAYSPDINKVFDEGNEDVRFAFTSSNHATIRRATIAIVAPEKGIPQVPELQFPLDFADGEVVLDPSVKKSLMEHRTKGSELKIIIETDKPFKNGDVGAFYRASRD